MKYYSSISSYEGSMEPHVSQPWGLIALRAGGVPMALHLLPALLKRVQVKSSQVKSSAPRSPPS